MVVRLILIATILGGAATSARAEYADAAACSEKFVLRNHADPAAAERTCGCLVRRLPGEKIDEAVAFLLTPGGMAHEFIDDFSYWSSHPSLYEAIDECRFMGCAGTRSVTPGCDFDAALSADYRGDHKTAIERYSKYLVAYPASISAMVNRGRAYLEAGSYDLAIADFNRSIEAAGDTQSVYRYLAQAYHLAEQNTEALLAADKAIAAYGDDPWSYRFRAEANEALGHEEAAIADYRKVILINRGDENREIARAALLRLGVQP